ncbi:hypothetical protein VNI00_006854 [Paramarasmius palmivorus]|uniref:Cullin family profile domain-containing protein n=1 Tax=Paramarasmius palmivorus TaxID=297713 RepID=A0AAW0D888_9AGAR
MTLLKEFTIDAASQTLDQCISGGPGQIGLVKELRDSDKSAVEWIELLVEFCDWFHDQVNTIGSVLTYLNQVYIPSERGLRNIQTLAFSKLNEKLLEDTYFALRIKHSVNAWATSERESGQPHPTRTKVSELLNHLNTHGLYTMFEQHYDEDTRAYYSAESTEKAKELADDPRAFLQHVHSRIDGEVQRTKDIMLPGSWARIQNTVEHALMDKRTEWLATKALGSYLAAKDFESLSKMYQLFTRVGGIKTLCAAFKAHFEDTVKAIVTGPEAEMVEHLLESKNLAETVMKTSFLTENLSQASTAASTSTPVPKRPDPDFIHALNDAFASGFKARRKKPAEAIAKHLDKLLRKGQGSTSDAEYEALLDSVLSLYRYSDDKDVFRTFYHRQLAKRLLLGRSASDAIEKDMLKKLRDNYDAEFDQAQNMFTDLELAKEMMEDYHSKLPPDDPSRRLWVTVLQTSAWPFSTNRKITIQLLPELQAQLNAYDQNYYQVRHPKRKLTWDHALGTMTLKARFKEGVKELSVSLYQGVVLLLFNDTPEMTYSDIKEAIQLDDDDLRRTLQSLACGKKRVLTKQPAGPDVNDKDIFRFNTGFKDAKTKVHINSIQAKVTEEESERTNLNIEDERKHTIDAAVVRIMKAKKNMQFEALITETVDALKKHFKPDVAMIKKRIDVLVEEEYMERDPENRNQFKYVA